MGDTGNRNTSHHTTFHLREVCKATEEEIDTFRREKMPCTHMYVCMCGCVYMYMYGYRCMCVCTYMFRYVFTPLDNPEHSYIPYTPMCCLDMFDSLFSPFLPLLLSFLPFILPHHPPLPTPSPRRVFSLEELFLSPCILWDWHFWKEQNSHPTGYFLFVLVRDFFLIGSHCPWMTLLS